MVKINKFWNTGLPFTECPALSSARLQLFSSKDISVNELSHPLPPLSHPLSLSFQPSPSGWQKVSLQVYLAFMPTNNNKNNQRIQQHQQINSNRDICVSTSDRLKLYLCSILRTSGYGDGLLHRFVLLCTNQTVQQRAWEKSTRWETFPPMISFFVSNSFGL